MAAVRTLRFALGGLGVAAFGYGVVGLLTDPAIRDPGAVGQWLVAGLILHDAVLAPLVFAVCAFAYRFTGARRRGRLAALLLVGGSLVLISVPALLQQGRNANPTVLPLDYARNLGLLLAALVAASALYAGADALRRRRARPRPESPAEIETEPPAEIETEIETHTQTETVTDNPTDSPTKPENHPESHPEPHPLPESPTENEIETHTEAQAQIEQDPITEEAQDK